MAFHNHIARIQQQNKNSSTVRGFLVIFKQDLFLLFSVNFRNKWQIRLETIRRLHLKENRLCRSYFTYYTTTCLSLQESITNFCHSQPQMLNFNINRLSYDTKDPLFPSTYSHGKLKKNIYIGSRCCKQVLLCSNQPHKRFSTGFQWLMVGLNKTSFSQTAL